MRAICFASVIFLQVVALAQNSSISGGGPAGVVGCATGGGRTEGSSSSGAAQIRGSGIRGSGIMPGRPTAIGALSVNLRGDTTSCATLRRFRPSYSGYSSAGNTFFSRIFIDRDQHQYFGYELLLEQRPGGEYLATFGKPGMTPMEAAVQRASAGSLAIGDWSMREISLPQSKVVHEGDLLSIELNLDANAGFKVVDEITVQPYSSGLPRLTGLAGARPSNQGAPPVPSVEGSARDFTATDAEMTLTLPRVTINRVPQQAPSAPAAGIAGAVGPGQLPNGLIAQRTTGTLVWVYLPGRGRYVFSLTPRPDLDFQHNGEVRGGAVTFTGGTDTIALECNNEIAPGHAPYRLYVLFDPLWEPTAQAQKGKLAIGSVGVGSRS